MRGMLYSLVGVILLCVPTMAGHNHRQAVVVKQRVVEFDARTFLGVDGYYSTINQIRAEKFQEQQAQYERILIEQKAQIQLLKELLGQGIIPNPVTPEPVEPEPGPVPPKPIQPVDPGDYVPTQLDGAVFELFNNNCKKCHGKDDGAGGIKLIDAETDSLVLLPLEWRAHVHDLVNGVNLKERDLRAMPPGNPLNNEDVETLRLWMLEEASRLR